MIKELSNESKEQPSCKESITIIQKIMKDEYAGFVQRSCENCKADILDNTSDCRECDDKSNWETKS